MKSFTLKKTEEGKLTDNSRRSLAQFIETMKVDTTYTCEGKEKNKRSGQQNNYWWGVVVPMVKDGLRDAGYSEVKTNEDAHEVLKMLFIKKSFKNEQTGEEIPVTGSTTELNKMEFMNLLDEVFEWASSYLNISIPAPGEQANIFY